MRSRPTKAAEPSARYIIRYSTWCWPSMSPVKDFATVARVRRGRSGPSLYAFSSQLLMANRAFAVRFIGPPRERRRPGSLHQPHLQGDADAHDVVAQAHVQ